MLLKFFLKICISQKIKYIFHYFMRAFVLCVWVGGGKESRRRRLIIETCLWKSLQQFHHLEVHLQLEGPTESSLCHVPSWVFLMPHMSDLLLVNCHITIQLLLIFECKDTILTKIQHPKKCTTRLKQHYSKIDQQLKEQNQLKHEHNYPFL